MTQRDDNEIARMLVQLHINEDGIVIFIFKYNLH